MNFPFEFLLFEHPLNLQTNQFYLFHLQIKFYYQFRIAPLMNQIIELSNSIDTRTVHSVKKMLKVQNRGIVVQYS